MNNETFMFVTRQQLSTSTVKKIDALVCEYGANGFFSYPGGLRCVSYPSHQVKPETERVIGAALARAGYADVFGL